MRILLWHGWLLTGTGSNLYTSNIARVWRQQGHDVLVMCQQRSTAGLGYVDEAGDLGPGNDSWSLPDGDPPSGTGRCRVVRPHIGRLLPVFVLDDYEGFEVKRFVDLTRAELDAYTDANVDALAHAIGAFAPDAIITGHEVMGPSIALHACARTGRDYLAKLHGSGLEYAVKLQERYRHHAAAGLGGARVVVGGSRYMVAEAARHIPAWDSPTEVVNPGCDVELFRPRPREVGAPESVGYVGKLIASKGVHHLLAALAYLDRPRLKVTIVGFGGFEDGLAELWAALVSGDRERALRIALRGEDGPLERLVEWLEAGSPTSEMTERLRRVDLNFTGRLEHGPLAALLPTFDVMVAPSVVPEAFGMVAAEAASSGVLPVVPDHSGIGEAGAALETAIERPGLLRFHPADPISGIAARIDDILALEGDERAELERQAVAKARRAWSWDRVAGRLLELAVDPGAAAPGDT